MLKNNSAYFYIIKIKLITALVYRFEFIASIVASGIMMFSTVFLWKAVYHALTQVDGLTENQMITYAILSVLLGMLFNISVEKSMYERILQGDIAIDFVRPTDIMLCYLAEDIGVSISAFIMKFIPIFILVSVFYFPPMPVNFVSFLLFIISSVLSYGILWIIEALIGTMHMRFFELGNIGFIKDTIIALLSGSVVPIWFFPEPLRTVLGFLPFPYTYQTPLGIYIGKYSVYEALVSMTIQAIWFCLLLLLLNTIWSKFSKKVMVYGG